MSTVQFRVYTRETQEKCYPYLLASAVHLAYRKDEGEFIPLNRNYGILFELGEVSEQNTIVPKGFADPKVFAMEDGFYGICAIRTEKDGSLDAGFAGQRVLWKTKDFIGFERVGAVADEELEEKELCDVIALEETAAQPAIAHWSAVQQTELLLPEIKANSAKDLEGLYATALYSDGSTAKKRLTVDASCLDFTKPGCYEVPASVGTALPEFPIIKGYGDPVLMRHEGKWYFIATNDNTDNVGLYLREADCLEDLFREDAVEHLILPYDPARHLIQTFWAPEFHWIGGELYIILAIGPEQWGPQCHVMKWKKGLPLTEESSWEDPIPVVRMDGSPLAPNAISLDMTYIQVESGSYVAWSYRSGIRSPFDTGSMIYIARVNEKEPWRLASEPVLLTRPLYGWENVNGTINNEAPYPLYRDGKVYLAYSGGAANGYTYAVGLITADGTADLTDLSSWHKSVTPVLTFYSVEGQFGPGHNAFCEDEDGNVLISFHGETDIASRLRCIGIRRVHFRANGRPDFELSAQEDLREDCRKVILTVQVQ